MEQKNCNEWNRENFNDILKDSLKYLKTCIEEEDLPNYMIPQRNMFQDEISKSEQGKLMKTLEILINTCPFTLIKDSVLKEIVETDIDGMISHEVKEKMKIDQEKDLQEEEGELSKSAEGVNDGEQKVQDTCQIHDHVLSTEEERILQVIPKRKLREQFVLAIFALSPKQIAIILKQVFEAKQQREIIYIISKDVFPYIREQNPYDFFNELNSKTDAELFASCAGTSQEQSCVLL
jgi:hypothetical protein